MGSTHPQGWEAYFCQTAKSSGLSFLVGICSHGECPFIFPQFSFLLILGGCIYYMGEFAVKQYVDKWAEYVAVMGRFRKNQRSLTKIFFFFGTLAGKRHKISFLPVVDWCNVWKMKVNYNKSVFLRLTSKVNFSDYAYFIDGFPVEFPVN